MSAQTADAGRRLPPRARRSLWLIAGLMVALVACWYGTYRSVAFARADAHAYFAFYDLSLGHHGLQVLAQHIADLCQPVPYVFLAAVPVSIALLRRRWTLAVALAIMIPAAILTSETLKPLLAAPRPAAGVTSSALARGSWPSGHSTAAMILAMALLLASPARWRPHAGVIGTLFALGVIYSVLTLGWHYPSDALGAVLVASVWTLAAVAVVSALDDRYGRNLSPFGPDRGEWLAHIPSLGTLVASAALPAVLVLVLRGHQILDYANGHTAFLIAVLSIGGLVTCAPTALTVALSGSDRAARAAHLGRLRHG